MKIIPFRIKASEEEDNYSEVYSFLVQGTKKEAYEVELDIDSFNDLGLTDERCTCPHWTFRALECKHIIECKRILNEFNIDTKSKFQTADTLNLNNTNNNQQGEKARFRKDDSTNKISDRLTPENSLAINGDINPADSQFHGGTQNE